MLFWLLVQLTALALSAFRVPLAAAYPQPAESQAIRVLLVAQFTWASILFPSLLRTWSMTLLAAGSAGVMLMLAASLEAWPLPDVAPIAAYLSLWILVLATFRAIVPSRWQTIGSAVVTTWIVGTPLLNYLRIDFGDALPVATTTLWSPLASALATPLNLSPSAWWGEVGIELALCGALAAISIQRFHRSHR